MKYFCRNFKKYFSPCKDIKYTPIFEIFFRKNFEKMSIIDTNSVKVFSQYP